ncbi:MAG: hypothetical protein J7L96_11250 [Bacteroidales bacterium]|nr:hypothetical protein [Bacteroidales bacterium]
MNLYALGFIAGWGAHPLDIAVWGVKEKMNDISIEELENKAKGQED